MGAPDEPSTETGRRVLADIFAERPPLNIGAAIVAIESEAAAAVMRMAAESLTANPNVLVPRDGVAEAIRGIAADIEQRGAEARRVAG